VTCSLRGLLAAIEKALGDIDEARDALTERDTPKRDASCFCERPRSCRAQRRWIADASDGDTCTCYRLRLPGALRRTRGRGGA